MENIQSALEDLFAGNTSSFNNKISDILHDKALESIQDIKPVLAQSMFSSTESEE